MSETASSFPFLPSRVGGWDNDGVLPCSLPVARAVLFYEYRSWRFSSFDPEGDDEIYIRALLAHIGEISGGTVAGPPDIVP